MWHVTYTQVNQGDSWLLMIGSQIGSLIFDIFLAITYVLNTQMGHVSLVRHLRFKSFPML
jgi:hypothetical protein